LNTDIIVILYWKTFLSFNLSCTPFTSSPSIKNVLPAGINAVAGLHDIFQIALGEIGGWARITFNVPGMIPAAYITYGGMIDQYVF
jgi:hypothetical protein